jgi:hypothetical protein
MSLRWPYVVPAGWFVLLVVASGLITYVQAAVSGIEISVQIGGRVLLVALALIAMLASGSLGASVIGSLTLPLVLFVASALGAFLLALPRHPESRDAVESFMFMYGIGLLLVLFVLAPVVVRLGVLFRLLCAVSVAFGLLQTIRQDLLLPSAHRERFGIIHDHFVNDHVRVVGFFASPPRFAEFLVLMASYVQYGILVGRRRSPLTLLSYGAILFVLYNTFSRSGYVLFLATLTAQLILLKSHVMRQRGFFGALRLYVVFASLTTAMGLLVMGWLPFDTSIVDGTSLAARQGHWTTWLRDFESQGLLDLILGSGKAAHFSALSSEYLVLDNVALAVLLYSGVAGLMIFLYLYYRVFREGMRMRSVGNADRWIPILAFYPCLLLEGMFVDNHNTIFLVQFAILGMITWERLVTSQRGATSEGQARRLKYAAKRPTS